MSGEPRSLEQVQLEVPKITYEDKPIYLKEETLEHVENREIYYYKYYIHEIVGPLSHNLDAPTLYRKLFNHIYIFLQEKYSDTNSKVYHFGLLEQDEHYLKGISD